MKHNKVKHLNICKYNHNYHTVSHGVPLRHYATSFSALDYVFHLSHHCVQSTHTAAKVSLITVIISVVAGGSLLLL